MELPQHEEPARIALERWYGKHDCSHAHCPCGCDHPQPFLLDGRLVCGECAIRDGYLCEMIPCGPDTCA